MGKKGLSADDKRRVILSIYHDKKEPFNLKEIELLGAKMGVVQQTIKDVNQSLCDDSMVNCDKIGSANFFWSFPSKYTEDLKRKRENLNAVLNNTQTSEEKLDELKRQRCAEDRGEKMEKLRSLELEERELDLALSVNKENDPQELKRIQTQAETNKSHANRWTDNVWTCKKYLTKSKGLPPKDVDKMLKINDSFDYV